MVERSICIREAPGSIPGFSSFSKFTNAAGKHCIVVRCTIYQLVSSYSTCVRFYRFLKMPRPGIEPGTFRSSVWRSPNWAISAAHSGEQAMVPKKRSDPYTLKFIRGHHQNIFLSCDSNLSSSWKSTPPSRIWTSDLEISDIGFILQSPALPTELSVVTSCKEIKVDIIHF